MTKTRIISSAAAVVLVALAAAPVSALSVEVNGPIRLGDIVEATVSAGSSVDAVQVELRRDHGVVGKTWAFKLPDATDWVALLGIPSWGAPGSYMITAYSYDLKGDRLGDYRVRRAAVSVEVTARRFRAEEIPLSGAMTDLRRTDSEQRREESRVLTELLRSTNTAAVHALHNFRLPIDTDRRTSYFGDRRTFVYQDGGRASSIHHGIDFGAPVGAPVYAAAGGRVVMARHRIITGNTVVLEHLPGIYTLYYHMDRIDAEVGTVIKGGTQLGTVGSTGLATGPHLHWEMRAAAVPVDPEQFLKRPILDISRDSDNIVDQLETHERR
jgi:murein DD-endopeptidase MepM/ murein hydrolase activator NlpD